MRKLLYFLAGCLPVIVSQLTELDKIDIVATSPLGKTEIHATDYSRPLIEEGK